MTVFHHVKQNPLMATDDYTCRKNNCNINIFYINIKNIYIFFIDKKYINMIYMLLTKTAATQNEVALSYHTVRGLYFLAVVFVATMYDVIYQLRYN